MADSISAKRAKRSIQDDVSDDDDAAAAREAFKNMNDSTRPEKFKDFVERREKLKEIHADIVKEEHLFVEERKKWVADNRNLYSDMNQFFVERCQWETEFKENHLKPLYEERCNVAKGIPSFWHTAMIANKMVSKQIAEKDKEALNFLNDIESRRTADLKGFELEFTFDDRNPYFKNKVLTKKYEVKDDNQSVSLKALGTKIDWYPSQNLAQGKSSESFFKFFNSYASLDPLSFDKEADELKGDIPMDYVIG
ncbi:nucleosome assembly protein 1;1-like [Rosa rugosa]|uniref:nucleosome assembly protein 1;1-like n=1 Tax=Rosa rugosa TaxID=74645 RepID=UPI002B41635D|nr:nucleosome assembly protein 1;1-like [Rosa rugosa]